MTIEELKQFRWLKQEITLEQERLAQLEAQVLGAAKLGTMPAPSGTSRKTENCAVAIEQIRTTLIEKIADYTVQRSEVEQFIANISDSLTRQIFTLRFVEALTWEDVAARIGGGNTADSVRMVCNRYIDAHKEMLD